MLCRSTSRRSSAGVGRRRARGCGGWAQWRARSLRRQPITVASFTISITLLRCRRSNARDNAASTVRSAGVNLGRSICHCRTSTWWRRARISASRLSPNTNISPRRAISSQNRCKMTDDTAGYRTDSPPRRKVQRSDRAWHRQDLVPRAVAVQFQTAVHVSLKNQVATDGQTTISCSG